MARELQSVLPVRFHKTENFSLASVLRNVQVDLAANANFLSVSNVDLVGRLACASRKVVVIKVT